MMEECEQGMEIEKRLNELIENHIYHLHQDVNIIKGTLILMVPLIMATLALVVISG